MKPLLTLLCLLPLAVFSAEPARILFRVEFAADSTVADVDATLVGKDADGFSTSRSLRTSTLPPTPKAQFAALQGDLSAAANAGGWRLVGGEMAQTGSACDYQDGPNPDWRDGVSPSEVPPTVRVPIPGTARPVLTLWLTQTREGRTRYQTITSEQWPPEVRAAVLALWAWLCTQP